MTTEQWKSVDDAQDYEVSNHGNVRRSTPGPGTAGGNLQAAANADGYMLVSLRVDGKTASRYVHDLVGKAFMESPGKGHSVQHKDHDRSNNRSSNLEWVAASVNSADGRITAEKLKAIRKDLTLRRNSLTIAVTHKVSLSLVKFLRKQMREKEKNRAKT